MTYEIDLEQVWDLPYSTKYWKNIDGGYCAVGKLAKASGNMNGSMPATKFYIELKEVLCSYGYEDPVSFGELEHDASVYAAETPEEKKAAHERATRKLLEICLKEGLIKLKDSDLEIVKELKKYEKETANV